MVAGAEIQVEHGNFARVHNGILEALAQSKFTQYEFRCLLFLLRKTYGYGQKEDAISLSQWVDGTGIARPHVSRTLRGLVKKKVILRSGGRRGRGKAAVYEFNKYHEKWGIETGDGDASFSEEKVPEDVPIKKVPEDVPFSEEKVRVEVTEKVRVEVPTKDSKDNNISSDTDLTEQQQYFDAVCKCVGWDHKIITDNQRGQVAQTLGVLKKGGYSLGDLRTFYKRWFTEDWRGKKGQHPTISQLRAEIGKLHSSANGTHAANAWDALAKNEKPDYMRD